MQRFVTLSSSHASSFVLPSPVPAGSWKSARDGRGASLLQAWQPVRQKNQKNYNGLHNIVNPFVRGGENNFCVPCCPQGCYTSGGGLPPRRKISLPGLVGNSGNDIRSQSVVRGTLGNRPSGLDPADEHHLERHLHQYRGKQRNHPKHVVDSVRDFRADSWWTDDAGNDDDSENDGALPVELWTSQIILQLSLFWNLLGYSPSRVDEWLISHEARRRLNSLNSRSRFSSSASASFSPLSNAPLGRPFEGVSAVANSADSRSVRFSDFVSTALPSIRPRERLFEAFESLRELLCPDWLAQMSQTYGVSFMMLVALGYLLQGFRCFPWFAVGYMLKDGLQVDPGYMQFLLSSAALPMVLKPVYGIISDTVYIRGAHRVPYLAIAGVLQLMSWGALAMSSYATSSAILFTAALTFGNLGAAIADVMNDALVAEVSKKQKGSAKGELQSFAWLLMASGGLLGNLLAGFALRKLELTSMYFIFLCLLGLHLVTCFFVHERDFDLAPPAHQTAASSTRFSADDSTPVDAVLRKRNVPQQGIAAAAASGMGTKVSTISKPPSLFAKLNDQVDLLGKLLKKKEISHTLLWFCASYAMIPVLGSSIFFYQTQALRIDPTFIGFSRMVGQVGLMVGSQLYGGVLKGLPTRKLLGRAQFLLSIFMLSDLLLVKRVNLQFGIPDAFYVLFLSGMVECVSQFKVLPVIVRLGQLCPPGSEGSLMAFFSSCHCLAGLCSGYFGVYLAQSLKISAQSFEGLPLGIFIQAMFALLPILFVSLVPSEDTSKPEKVLEKVQ